VVPRHGFQAPSLQRGTLHVQPRLISRVTADVVGRRPNTLTSHDVQLAFLNLMSMFNLKLGQSTNLDISSELLDANDFTPEKLLTLEYAHDLAVQAFDPLTGLLVIGRLA
jgi:hypothetical protein